MPVEPKKRLFSIVFVAAMYIAALWPFEFIPVCLRSSIQWLPEESGIEIGTCGTLSSPVPPRKLEERFRNAPGITLEIDLMTETIDQSGPARIVSYSFNTNHRNFTLGQQNGALVFRLRTTATTPNGNHPELEVPSVFKPGTRQHLAVTYDGRRQHLYVDGKRVHTGRNLTGNFLNWNSGHFFLLGNELTGNRPWRGKLYYVALYDHALSEDRIHQCFNSVRNGSEPPHTDCETGPAVRFRFSEGAGSRVADSSPAHIIGDLTVARFHSPLKEIFLNDFTMIFSVKDMLLNILGFIPLSFIVVLNMSRTRRPVWLKIYLAPILVGFAVSFSFEFLQQFTYSRNPNVLDILYNTGGAALGSIGVHILKKTGER